MDVYHGTSAMKAEQILKEGMLTASNGHRAANPELTLRKECYYVTTCWQAALSDAVDECQKNGDSLGCVFVLDIPAFDLWLDEEEVFEFYIRERAIGRPDCVDLVWHAYSLGGNWVRAAQFIEEQDHDLFEDIFRVSQGFCVRVPYPVSGDNVFYVDPQSLGFWQEETVDLDTVSSDEHDLDFLLEV